MGSLKRSVEGERNGGNTVRKGESCIDVIIKRTLITSALSLFSTIINLAQLYIEGLLIHFVFGNTSILGDFFDGVFFVDAEVDIVFDMVGYG